MGEPEQPEVPCLACKRPLRTPKSRARRYGEGCWRKRRRAARAAAAPVTLPGLGRAGSRGQAGPHLLTGVDQLGDLDEDDDR
ncbi:DUF6011 domain-containing protein [Micromonospora chokoriensis]|uniref:DUF6011 domain-containing protein n=1 Tax=Micromonospora chokoriensis TaxID=356851 RepID=UPI0004C366A1|nr:DUF6011 domain-containing protein [Micromonospora chokoriensis]